MIKPLLNVFLRLGARWSAWKLLWEMVVDEMYGKRGEMGSVDRCWESVSDCAIEDVSSVSTWPCTSKLHYSFSVERVLLLISRVGVPSVLGPGFSFHEK